MPRMLRSAPAAAMLALVLLATLLPSSSRDTGRFQGCLLCGEFGLADFVRNVVLFLPLGLAVRRAGVPARWTLAGLAALSLGIELAQLWIPGRDSALGDVAANTTGAAVAVLLYRGVPRRVPSASASAVAAGTMLLVVAATGLALRPHFPATTYFGQWTPELGNFATYRGTVLGADIAGLPMHSWRLDRSDAVRRHLAIGDPISVRAVAGPPPDRLAPIFNIMDHQQRLIVLIGADGEDLVFDISHYATDARLETPWLRWPGALTGIRAGDTLAITLRRTGSSDCIAVNSRERCLQYRASDGWELIQYWPRLGPGWAALVGGAWLFMLGVPLGVLMPSRRDGAVVALLALLGAAFVPPLVGLSFAPLATAVPVALGIAGAWWACRLPPELP